MMDTLIGLGLAVAILATAYALASFFWQPEHDVERSMLGHWFRSLIRLYESDSFVRVSHRGSPLRFELLRRLGSGRECWLVFSCSPPSGGEADLRLLRDRVDSEPRLRVLPGPAGEGEDGLHIQVSIPDIWSADAAGNVVDLAEFLLDTHGVGAEARSNLEFIADQSVAHSLEASRRLRAGEIQEW